MSVQSGFFWDESFITATSASLATNQFCIVALGGTVSPSNSPSVSLCLSSTGGTAAGFGILQNDPTAGKAATVRILGISKCVASTSASVAFGDQITSTTGGQACTADSTGQRVLGTAITASTGVLGTYIEVLMTGPYSRAS